MPSGCTGGVALLLVRSFRRRLLRRRLHRRPLCVRDVLLVPSDTGCDRSGVGTRALGQYRRCSAATCLPIPDGLLCGAPVEDLIKGIRCIRRSASIGFTTHRPRLLNHRPELAEQMPLQDSTTINPGPGIFVFPPYQRFELLWAANPLKGKGRIGHSVGLCRRQLMLVFVVVGVAAGPLDPGSGLTGTLHYIFDTDCAMTEALSFNSVSLINLFFLSAFAAFLPFDLFFLFSTSTPEEGPCGAASNKVVFEDKNP